MMARSGGLVYAILLVGCRSESGVVVPEEQPPVLELTVDEPVYGAFVGDRAVVSGAISDPYATVWIEGYRANVGIDGAFTVEVPVEGDFRVIDVEATRPGTHLRERRPVFSGVDPMESWTGGVGIRVTPVALVHIAEVVEAEADAVDLPGLIDGLLPSLELGGFAILPTGTTLRPAEATLVPGPDGITLSVAFRELEVAFDLVTGTFGTTPVVLGIDELAFSVAADVAVDADGNLVVEAADPTLTLGTPTLLFGVLEPTFLEAWASGLTAGLAGVLSGALDLGVVLLGDLVVPFEDVETDALGFPLALALLEADTDPDGIGVRLGVDLGVPAPGRLGVPSVALAGPSADVALSVHEGLLQGLLDNTDVASLVDLDLELAGLLGEAVALPVAALPGGDQLPEDRTAMCLTLAPGEASVARVKPELAPLVVLTLPDVRLLVGVATGGPCEPWLEASLAVQVSFDAEGTTLETRFAVVDGAVLAYAPGVDAYDEDDVVAGLGALVDAASTLLGSSVAIDLSTLFTGFEDLPVGELQPRILDARAGAEGEVVIGVSLWD